MTRAFGAVVLAVLLAPVASAANYVHTVREQVPGGVAFNPQDAYNNFTFALADPPFKFGPVGTTNIGEYYVSTTVHKRGSTGTADYSDDFRFVIEVVFNGTNRVRADLQYDRVGAFFPFVGWQGTSRISFNGVAFCENKWLIGYYDKIGDPHPGLRFSFGLHPDDPAGRDEVGVSNLVPYLKVLDFDDWHSGDRTGDSGEPGGLDGGCQRVLTSSEAGGFDPDSGKLAFTDVNELTTAPFITAGSGNQIQQTVVFDYFFQNVTRARTRYNETIAAGVCDGFSVLGFCVSAARAFQWVGEKSGVLFDSLESSLPYGSAIRLLIEVPLAILVTVFTLFFLFFFVHGDGVNVGTSLLVWLVYFTCWGCVVAAAASNPRFIWQVPMGVFYGVGAVVVFTGRGVWWLLVKSYELAVAAFGAIGQWSRG